MVDLSAIRRRQCFHVTLILIFGVTLTLGQHEAEFQFSKVARQMPENVGRRIFRHTWILVPHLYEKDSIHVSICLEKRTIVDFNNITYSNDGGSETIVIEQDGAVFGKFDTESQGDWGRLWDIKKSSGFIGRSGMLSAGIHNITIRVNSSADCFGVELWSMYVSVFTAVDQSTFWCDSGFHLPPKKWECLSEIERQAVATRSALTTSTAPPTATTLPPSYVTVMQNSFKSDCLDKKNVNIGFSAKNLAGAVISFRQDNVPATTSNFANATEGETRYCDSDIWQIGHIDSDNKEFQPIYPGKSLVINITNVPNPEQIFPAKLLPFVTTDITIHFDMPSDIRMQKGSAFLALGLLNLTKNADVGLRFFDHTIQAFSDIHILRFTPAMQAMGWNIPHLDETNARNSIHLHFQSEANVIMFDFLKLVFNKRDERKFNTLIARNGPYRVRGLRYATTKGMKVVVDNMRQGLDMEDLVLLYQLTPFSRFETVLRVHSSGMFYPYKTFPVDSTIAESMIIDVTGLYFAASIHQSPTSSSPTPISSLHINTTSDVIVANYNDGSSVHLALRVTDLETKLQVVKFERPLHKARNANDAHGVVVTSTHVNSFYAGVNKLSTGGMEKVVLDNLDQLSGHYSYTLKKTSSNTLFYANSIIDISLPR